MHVVAVPYPAQGHIVPLMQLCVRLAEEGFTVTFVNTEHNHARILQSQAGNYYHNPADKSEPTMARCYHNIRLVGIPGGLPPELHADPNYVVAAFQASEALAAPFEKLLEELRGEEGVPPVSCILSDVMTSWTQNVADRLGIPRLAFWTSSAAVYSVVWHMYRFISQGLPTFKAVPSGSFGDDDTEMVSNIPGLPPMDWNDLPIIVRSGPADFIYQFLMRHLAPLERAACVLLNTFHALEKDCIEALMMPVSDVGVPCVSIGPLIPPALMMEVACGPEGGEYAKSASLFSEDDSCIRWLDTQRPGSVLYISFGSIFTMSGEQMRELAAGLEASGQAFLWSARPDLAAEGGDVLGTLPPSFLHNTEGRGMLVRWCPQLQVLSHPAVGGFLTHCGWNSILESVAMGIPMLCWPDVGERRTNARLVVSLWRVGLEVAKPKGQGCVPRHEVERVIRQFMEPSGPRIEMRSRACNLRDAAIAALQKGGSSSRSWEQVLDALKSWGQGRGGETVGATLNVLGAIPKERLASHASLCKG